jgi:hypothetical protein
MFENGQNSNSNTCLTFVLLYMYIFSTAPGFYNDTRGSGKPILMALYYMQHKVMGPRKIHI